MRCHKLLLVVSLLACAVASQAAPRIVLFDAKEGTTSRALQALQIPATVVPPADYGSTRLSLFAYQVAIWGMDNDTARLAADPQPLLDFVRSGGVFLGMRATDCTWVPAPLKMDKAYGLGKVLQADHPLFTTPNRFGADSLGKVHGGSLYRAFYDLGAGWVPLVSAGAEQTWDKTPAASTGPHYGLVELPLGKGRIILCQMIPEYAFINDDKGQPGPGSQFCANLLAYVNSLAPNWPAPRPRLVPASFHADLSGLLRQPTAQGTLAVADPAWQVTTGGPFTCRTDRRGVMTMSHADCPAAPGGFAQMTRTVKLLGRAGVSPAASHVFLRFYNSDDYCGGTEPLLVGDARVSTHENRIKGVRFKQVLVNGKVVWEEDVLGLNPLPADRRFHLVDISDCLGQGGTATLALRVEDRGATAEDQPFATDVYWAGLDLLPGLIQIPVEAGKPATKAVFTGPQGRYAVLVRALDEHTGRGKLQVSIDGKALGSAQLTADDYRWYWIDFGQANLKPGSAITVKAMPDGGEACSVQSVAFVPASLLAAAVPGSAGIPARLSPSSPLYRPAPLVTRATFPVLVSGPAPYKPQGEVISGGMPFAYGAVKSEQNLRLLNDQNKEVPLQTRVLAKWPDGSLKWVLFTFPTAPGALRCEYGTQVRRETAKGMTVTQDDKTISINTGPLQVTISKTNGDLCETLALEGKQLKPAGVRWPLVVGVGQDTYSSDGDTVTRCEVVDAGPERATVRRVGRFRSANGQTMLEYDVLMTFDANSGVMRVQPAITHKEVSAEEQLKGLSVEVKIPFMGQGEKRTEVWREAAPRSYPDWEFGLSQTSDVSGGWSARMSDGVMADGMLQRANGCLRVAGNGLSVDFIPRWFWQMYPAHNHGFRDGLSFGLGGATLHQGEAIWNDFALRFSTDTGQPKTEDFDALANPAVALAEPSYTASTLALCQFAPEDKPVFPEYEATVEGQYKTCIAKREARHEYGVENFGDDTFEWGYGPSYTFWSNQEYDHHYGMLLQFLRSGDWRWWELGDAGTRHHVNEDCYHFTAPGQEYRLGSPHHHNSKHIVEKGWVADHTVAASDVTHAWVEGQIAYYFMTGDPRTFENWNAMGDWYVWCVNNNQYGAGGQERGPGWTLVALSALYNATYDPKYLAAGNKVMDWLRSVQDPVRGVVSIPISEQPSYEGGSAFMHGIVARGAGRWYEATGDERGKLAAIGIADWLTSEAMGPPSLFYYKQAPRIKGSYGNSEWQCISALTYAMKYGDRGYYGPLAKAHYLSGRAGERSMAWLPQSLALLRDEFWPLRAQWSVPEALVAPSTPAQVRLQLTNATAAPLSVSLKVTAAPAGLAVSAPPAPVALPPGTPTEVPVPLSVTTFATASGLLQLQVTGKGVTRVCSLPVRALPVLVQIEKAATEGQLQAPFVLDKDRAAAAVRDAAFTGNPRQPGERAGWVAWQVKVPTDGLYGFTADCFWLDDKGNSLYLQVDDGPEVVFGNDSDMGRWHRVSAPEPLRLTAGLHTLRLLNREDGARVRRMTLTNVQ